MRRWLAILLLVLLPTQATWAVVAGYCVDEPDTTVSHFGHHDRASHSHALTLLDAPSDTADSSSDGSINLGHDCGHCHGHFAGILTGFAPLQFEQFRSLSTPLGDDPLSAYAAVRPERPKWVPLA